MDDWPFAPFSVITLGYRGFSNVADVAGRKATIQRFALKPVSMLHQLVRSHSYLSANLGFMLEANQILSLTTLVARRTLTEAMNVKISENEPFHSR
jgi:hypothetical protein